MKCYLFVTKYIFLITYQLAYACLHFNTRSFVELLFIICLTAFYGIDIDLLYGICRIYLYSETLYYYLIVFRSHVAYLLCWTVNAYDVTSLAWIIPSTSEYLCRHKEKMRSSFTASQRCLWEYERHTEILFNHTKGQNICFYLRKGPISMGNNKHVL